MAPYTLTPDTARRLAVHAQWLDAAPAPREMLATIRQLGCLQLDPTKVVIQTQYLVLFSRLGAYPMSDFTRLMWDERQLFEYWAHCASIVLTEHYPLFQWQMTRRATSTSTHGQRVQVWIAQNQALYAHVLEVLHTRDHVPVSAFDAHGDEAVGWDSSGWTNGRNVERMLDHLWLTGEVVVSGRLPNARLWSLASRHLPEWTPREVLDAAEVTRRSVRVALRALGVGTMQHIKEHFTRGEYPQLPAVLAQMETDGEIVRVQIKDGDAVWKGIWYTLAEAPLETIDADWQPRMALLSPFDNLICDRKRTLQLFDFYFRLEIYTPAVKRQYGFFVLPILYGDRLIGRIDPKFDRKRGVLVVNAVHWENQPPNPQQQRLLADEIHALAGFLGAKDVEMPREVLISK